jgi:hypothetical protein
MNFYKITLAEFPEATEQKELAVIIVYEVEDVAEIFEDYMWGIITARLKELSQAASLSPPPKPREAEGESKSPDGEESSRQL